MARVLKSATPFEFNKIGDSITGRFVKTKDVAFTEKDGKVKNATGAILETEDGDKRIVWLSPLLADLFEDVNEGETITITFEKEKPATKKGYSPMKIYAVEVL